MSTIARNLQQPQWRTLACEYLAAKAQHHEADKLYIRATRTWFKLAKRIDDKRAFQVAGVEMADERSTRACQAELQAWRRLKDHLREINLVDRILAVGIIMCADVPHSANDDR
jgi:hypothetical protein